VCVCLRWSERELERDTCEDACVAKAAYVRVCVCMRVCMCKYLCAYADMLCLCLPVCALQLERERDVYECDVCVRQCGGVIDKNARV